MLVASGNLMGTPSSIAAVALMACGVIKQKPVVIESDRVMSLELSGSNGARVHWQDSNL